MKTVITILCITSFCIALSSCSKNDENTNNQANNSCKILKYESDESGGYTVNYTYSTNWNLLSMQVSVLTRHDMCTYKYDAKNRISYESRSNNDTVFYNYNENDLLTSAISKTSSGNSDTTTFEYNSNHQLIKRNFHITPFKYSTTYEWGIDGNVLTQKHYNILNQLINTSTYEYDTLHNKDLTDLRPLWEPKNVANIKTIYSNGVAYQTYNYTQYNSAGFPTQYTMTQSNGATINVTITYDCP